MQKTICRQKLSIAQLRIKGMKAIITQSEI